MNDGYNIVEFASLVGTSVKTLRRLDKGGFLVADRVLNNQYRYKSSQVDDFEKARSAYLLDKQRKYDKLPKSFKNLKFGRLTVIDELGVLDYKDGKKHNMCLCQCECGNVIEVPHFVLKAGYRKSCDCLRFYDSDTKQMISEFNNISESEALSILENNKDYRIMHNNLPRKPKKRNHVADDLVGLKFGFWSVISKGDTKFYPNCGGRVIYWNCVCECGYKKQVPGRDLKSGASQSCGCMSKISWLEKYTKDYLCDNNIDFDYQKSYEDLRDIHDKLLFFDFVVYKESKPLFIIECQGEQHYRPIKKFGGAKGLLKLNIHDKTKREYATNVLKIPVLEIDYRLMNKEDVYAKLSEIFKQYY